MSTLIKNSLEQLLEKEDLSFDGSYKLMYSIMQGEVSDPNISAILIALKSKGESSEEIAGFAKAMRDNCISINCDTENTIDVCGTGGDNSGSFNISTAAAFTVAGAGVNVAKHGNRSISSKSGSADVLQELGININLKPHQSEQALSEIGIAFLFAPLFHPAMKHAANVRKELGIKTVFNILGPLTNPAGVKKQIIGTFSRQAAKKMAEAAKYLEFDRVCFLCSNDKYDEIYLGDTTDIYEYVKNQEVKNYTITNSTFNYPGTLSDEIKGSTPEKNAEIILDVFNGKRKDGAFNTIVANSALALYSSGFSDDLNSCKEAAEASINRGAALKKIEELRKYSNNFS
ncbi:MAG: anthranilate phosphoribosyltransferase [Ignavibacteriaceae bacterium]|jgi:anthranilate phosphoribosyltransferase